MSDSLKSKRFARFTGLILSADSHADLVQKIDAMDLGKLEPWHAFILARLSDASCWEDFDPDEVTT